MGKTLTENSTKYVPATKVRTGRPPLYKVLMHNDDYTTMEFVIEVLINVFAKETVEATRLMLQIHQVGYAWCGTYPFEIAETKVDKVHRLARSAGYPLRCSLETE